MTSTYITTGTFARLCGTTKHTLIHYDQMGVLSPALVGENGYRYYAPVQMEVFHVIQTLRELDMSLADIRAYLDRRSPGEFAALMEEQARHLEAKIARLRRMKDMVGEKGVLARWAMGLPRGEVRLVEERAQWLVCTPALPMTSDWNVALPLAQHVRFCQEHHIVSPHGVGSMLAQEAAATGDPAGYTHYYTRVEKKPKGVAVTVRPAGEYLSYVHPHGYNDLPTAYGRILDHATREGLTLQGPFFEDVLLDELSVKGYENYVLHIAVRVG